MRNIITLIIGLLISNICLAQSKKTLSYHDYDGWKSLSNQKISNDGQWVSYEINPQKGDGFLYLYNVSNQSLDSIARGKQAIFSPENDFIAFKITPEADTIKALKLKKTKSDKMPKDTLCVWNLKEGFIKKYPRIKKFSVPEKEGNWIAAHFEKEMKAKSKNDTTQQDSSKVALTIKTLDKAATKRDSVKTKKKSAKKFKSKGTTLAFFKPSTNDSVGFEKVINYSVPRFGKGLFVVQSIGDSIEETKIKRLDTDNLKIDSLFHQTGKLHSISTDEQAAQLGFLFSNDTVKVKTYSLFHWTEHKNKLTTVIDTSHANLSKDWCAHTKGSLWFSEKGDKLFFGVGKRPQEEPKDTLLKEEKVFVDIWNWKDKRLQPMQNKNLKKDKDRSYKAVYLIKEKTLHQLETEEMKSVSIYDKGNWNFAIGYDDSPYLRASSWNAIWARDAYKIDLKSGKRSLIEKKLANSYSFSADGNFLCWYNQNDSIWYLNNIEKGTKLALSKNLEIPFYDELNDEPIHPRAYGVAGWSQEDKYVYIYDRFDIWKFDTSNKQAPICITNGNGRKSNTSYRYIHLDKDIKFMDETEGLLLSTFNHQSKNAGYTWYKNGSLTTSMDEPASFTSTNKAKNATKLIWRKGNFKNYPELYISEMDFSKPKVISNTNPQQSEYNWGDIQLVQYTGLNGEDLQGLLVTPENLDKTKKYPMIVYYYERSSDRLHRHYLPKPSRSTVNWSMYASNGYVLFIPDITYRDGDPGLCGYEAIMGGVMNITQQYDFIDTDNMGLQGQSWGGYQTAYMITRTNMFKAAMAGAPVSNMTSAYGGIRWGSGMSRMFQYEHTQSRIGGTLWDKLPKYIENSPLFFVPQIETPLLMMHNDKDGAVPWYQGIEMFVAMRRLNKPAWMLTYNNEDHNLTRRANSIDLSIRMMQFFDHYLKDKAAPVWMEHGIPAVEKGKNQGYELVE
ncbi:alpha/beta hydrolase family protein [Labilibacter marinus]|uniref:alpha/beta hydrolase family protein n=1 Tax=Labilibacter marinus TaxID=1477105 RepID=UPI0009500A71|nr:prolyl oligopeptidase family serine peptidase [Labilibacter marinus]